MEKDIEIAYEKDNDVSEESAEEFVFIVKDNTPLYILSILYRFDEEGFIKIFTKDDAELINNFLIDKEIDCHIEYKNTTSSPPEAISSEAQILKAIEKISEASEKITRRNMKIQVSEFIQVRCDSDPDFAALILNPKKNLVNCFKYINRMAMEWIKEDAKARGEELHGQIGGDVPDDIVFDWSIEYFQKTGLPEDEEKAKPVSPSPTQKSKDKKIDSKEEISKKANGKPATSPNNQKNKEPDLLDTGQLSLFG
ncbi:MAG TPA: hypothetical protein DCM73_00735 [Clostridiales bacterium]|nr:hypothetical protein [Clostridiales bacterium]